MSKDELMNDKQIKLTMYLKINQLHRNHLENLTYAHLLDVLFHFKWNTHIPNTIHEAVNDIMNLDGNEIVKELHALAIMEGANKGSDALDELLGGIKYD